MKIIKAVLTLILIIFTSTIKASPIDSTWRHTSFLSMTVGVLPFAYFIKLNPNPYMGNNVKTTFPTYHIKYSKFVSRKLQIGVNIALLYTLHTFNHTTVNYKLGQDPAPTLYKDKFNLLNTSTLFRVNYFFRLPQKLNFYMGMATGIRINKRWYTTNDPNPIAKKFFKDYLSIGKYKIEDWPIGFESTMGLLYTLKKSYYLNAEVGLGKSIIQVGITKKI